MKIKVSDLIARFLAEKSVDHVFAISGGASLHLIHSIADHPTINYICCHHEQACAMAADVYARVTNNIGVTVATSGPGATNLITGICGCYYDSVPLIAITGQVSTFRMTGNLGVRQIGFQETPIVDICKPIVKYAVQINTKLDVLYELEKAYRIATTGRKGPVLIDIPDNLQREFIDLSSCRRYDHISIKEEDKETNFELEIDKIVKMISNSERPVIVAGWGVHLSQSEKFLQEFAELFDIPIVATWAMIDSIDHRHPLYIGTFGTHGQRHSNFAVQNSDLIIALGTRLDTKATGTPVNSFARESKKIMVDIDPFELDKFDKLGLKIDLKINDDLTDIKSVDLTKLPPATKTNFSSWHKQISIWREKFLIRDKNYQITENKCVNPYKFFASLSNEITNKTNIIFDTGCSLAWGMQGFACRDNIRIYHDFNNTAMGWSLPGSIGSHFGAPDVDTICITGDGSFMMSIHELAVIKRHDIPIKIFVFNNSGYSMIQQTQEQWLESNYFASSFEGGLAFPEYKKIAESFNLQYFEISTDLNLNDQIRTVINCSKPTLCNVIIDSNMRVIPQVKAGKPNEEMEPLLSDEEFKAEMIVPIIE